MKKVKEIMVNSPRYCGKNETLQSVAKQMMRTNIGSMPVLDDNSKVIGMITDRDVCLAIGKDEKRSPNEITVKDVMSKQLFTCSAEDTLDAALKIMRTNKIGRLPVVDKEQKLSGLITLNHVVNKVYGTDEDDIQYSGNENVIKTLHSISERNKKEFVTL